MKHTNIESVKIYFRAMYNVYNMPKTSHSVDNDIKIHHFAKVSIPEMHKLNKNNTALDECIRTIMEP